MEVINRNYLAEYTAKIGKDIPKLIQDYNFSENSTDFDYLTKASAVYSSNIEGNSINLNSYMNYELSKNKSKEQNKKFHEIDEINNLIQAYEFAQNNKLNEDNLLQAHKLLSKNLLIKSKQGKYRTEPVGVFSSTGLNYMAIEPEFLKNAMETFFQTVENLLKEKLNEIESFYFASFIHLRFAHIHPFMDGNGRTARLLEKWFLTEKLGKDFWKIPSEKYYKENQRTYYATIDLGVNFYELDYSNCVAFLEILAKSLQ